LEKLSPLNYKKHLYFILKYEYFHQMTNGLFTLCLLFTTKNDFFHIASILKSFNVIQQIKQVVFIKFSEEMKKLLFIAANFV